MRVHNVMTKDPVTLKPTDTLFDAMKAFSSNDIQGCPVISKGKLVGVITQSDIIRVMDVHSKVHKTMDTMSLIVAAIKSEKHKDLKPEIRRMLKKEVRQYYIKNPISIDPKEDIYNAAKLINKNRIEFLPVIEKRKLVGVVSKIDILRAMT